MIRDFVNNNCAFTPPDHDTIPSTKRLLSEEELQSVLESLRQAGYDTAQFDKRVPERSSREEEISEPVKSRLSTAFIPKYGLDSLIGKQLIVKVAQRDGDSTRILNYDRVGHEAQAEDGIKRDSQGEDKVPK